jgi:hypothetical protein
MRIFQDVIEAWWMRLAFLGEILGRECAAPPALIRGWAAP